MVLVEFQYSHRRKKIVIEGQVDQKALLTINLLQRVCKRFYLDKCIDFFMTLFNYQNQQLGSILILLILTIATQLVSHFYFNTKIFNGYSHIITSCIILYIFIFQIIVKKQIKIYILGLLQIVLGIALAVIKSNNYEDYGASVYMLVLNSLCMFLTISKNVLEEQLKRKIFSLFQFQSNLITFVYLICKFIQIYLPYLSGDVVNCYNLIPSVTCITLINLLKIWHLFDFNAVFLVQSLSNINKDHKDQHKKNAKKRDFVEQILSLGNSNGFKTYGSQNTQITKKLQINQDHFQQKDSIKQTNTIQQESLQNSDSSNVDQENDRTSQQKNPYNKHIWLAFLSNGIFGGIITLFIIFETYSNANIILMSLGLIKTLIMCLYCQHQFIMIGQVQKNSFYYLQSFLADLFLILPLTLIALLFQNVNSTSPFADKFSLFVNCSIPFLTILLYRANFQKIIQFQHNSAMLHFYFCWVQLLSLRQTFIIMLSGHISVVNYLIDGILIVYCVTILVFYSNINFFKKILNQIQKIRTIKKRNLYIMQNIRNWKFDPINLNQKLFFINFYTLFVGYYQIKSHSFNFSKQEIQYLIVLFSSILIHLLNVYNTYYYQIWTNNQQKPFYSPYYNCIIIALSSITYVVYSFFIVSDAQSHKSWSFQFLVIVILIVLNNTLGNYAYETINAFRNAFKTFNIVFGYFMFYYPFITIFTIYYFYNKMSSSYIYYYAIGGFGYLTFSSIITGIFVHFILNLTQKSKKSLFLVKQVGQQFKKINMKEDSDFVSMIQNLYELMDGDSQKLLQQLKKQKMSRVMIHDDQNIQYDYSIGDALAEEKQVQLVKVFNNSTQQGQGKLNSRKQIRIMSIKNIPNQKIKTKINFYNRKGFKDKNNQAAQKQFFKESSQISNQNTLQIKRLIEEVSKYSVNSNQLQSFKRKAQISLQFKQIKQDSLKLNEMMHRFYHFLCSPSQQMNFNTFCLLNKLLMRKNKKDLKQTFNKYSQNAETFTEQNFRTFLASYIIQQYKISSQNQTASNLWQQFCLNQLLFYVQVGNDVFRYYMRRKNIDVGSQTNKVWNSIKNQEENKQLIEFKQKYNVKRFKALIKKARESQSKSIQVRQNAQNHELLPIPIKLLVEQLVQKQHQIRKKHILFMSPQRIYTLIVQSLVESLQKYQKLQHQHFKLQSIRFSGANFIAILTKIFDYGYLYMYGSLYSLYAYSISDFNNGKFIFSFINYNYLFGLAFLGVVTYIGLIVYHRKEFTKGSLGLDQNQKPLSLMSFKFYTQFLLFLMGSPLSNLFIMASLNSFLCDQSSLTLWNFPSNECYSTIHLFQMFFSLIILLSYYPLASLIFPFSTAIDKTLQIKYKSEYEIIYLQSKFLINGINIFFNPLNFQTQQLIKSISKTIVCIILTGFFHKMQPCSVDFINSIELKIYIGLTIINAASILCYFVGFNITVISFGVLLFIYILYSILSSCSVFSNRQSDKIQQIGDVLVNQKFRKQNQLKRIMEQKDINQQGPTGLNLYKIQTDQLSSQEQMEDNSLMNLKKFVKIQNKQDKNSIFQGNNKTIEKRQIINLDRKGDRYSNLIKNKSLHNNVGQTIDNKQNNESHLKQRQMKRSSNINQKFKNSLKKQIGIKNAQKGKSFSVQIVNNSPQYVSAQKRNKQVRYLLDQKKVTKTNKVKWQNQK